MQSFARRALCAFLAGVLGCGVQSAGLVPPLMQTGDAASPCAAVESPWGGDVPASFSPTLVYWEPGSSTWIPGDIRANDGSLDVSVPETLQRLHASDFLVTADATVHVVGSADGRCLCAVPTNGGPARQLGACSHELTTPLLMDDGYLVWRDDRGLRATSMTDGHDWSVAQPAWSALPAPSGHRLALASGFYPGELRVYDLATSGEGTLSMAAWGGGEWSGDGSRIAWLENTGKGTRDLYVAEADGSSVRALLTNADILSWWWSPTSSTLWTLASTGTFTRVDVEGVAAPVEMSPPEGKVYLQGDHAPTFSPDGQHVAYACTTGLEQVVQVVQCMDSMRVSPPGFELNGPYRWAPDSSALAWLARQSTGEIHLQTARADGAAERDAGFRAYAFAWSPDASGIAYHDDRATLVLDVASGESIPVNDTLGGPAQHNVLGWHALQWSADGGTLYFSARAPAGRNIFVYRSSLDSSEPTRVSGRPTVGFSLFPVGPS